MNFASDNWSGATPAVLDAIGRHNAGFAPGYGADPLTTALRQRFADVFETEVEIHFVATGTAANTLSMAALTKIGGLVFCSTDAHLHNDEYGATESATGMKLVPIPAPVGKITPDALAATLASYPMGGRTGPATALSLTNATECGTVYSATETAALCDLAKARDMAVRLDGARFGNAVAATGASPADLTWKAGVDLMSFGGTKNGCMGVEAVVFFDPKKAWEFELRRKRGAHLFSKHRFLSAQMAGYLQDDLWRETAQQANANAAYLAEGLRKAGAAFLHAPQANMLFPRFPRAIHRKLHEAGAKYYLWDGPLDGPEDSLLAAGMVCDWSISKEQIDQFLSLF